MSRNPEASCDDQVGLHLERDRGGNTQGGVLGSLPTQGLLSALNFMILMFVNFCLPST